MTKNRLEAFSDGVFAIIITIMVLDLKVPHGRDLAALWPLWPVLLSYILSFVFLGIYWNNHHHMLQAVKKIDGRNLWANLHLLFWLSLIPFVTGWMGENGFAAVPVALYGCVLLAAAIAYTILLRSLLRSEGEGSPLHQAIHSNFKANLSLVLYLAAAIIAIYQPIISCLLYVVVAVMWLIPDPRIERRLKVETNR